MNRSFLDVKGLIQATEKTYREVQPIGILYTQGQAYFLLNLKPIVPDWESLPERRFVCVPVDKIDTEQYSFARHVVTDAYAIEYHPNIAPIQVWDLGNIDLSRIDLEPEDLEIEPDPVELMDILREVEETNG